MRYAMTKSNKGVTTAIKIVPKEIVFINIW